MPTRRVIALIAVLTLGSAAALAQPAPDRDACPYAAVELQAALGVSVDEGKPGPTTRFAGGRAVSCQYAAQGKSTASVVVNRTVYTNPADPSIAMMARMRAGAFEKVAADPDGAEFQEQGDITNATLHYLRKGSQVEVRVTIGPKQPGFAAMKARLLTLRRLP